MLSLSFPANPLLHLPLFKPHTDMTGHPLPTPDATSVPASRRPAPSFSPVPALLTIIDEAPKSLLRNCLKLICERTDEDARNVGLMLEQAKYCEDSDDEEDNSDICTVDYQPHRDDDPVADTLFVALLSRKAELHAKRKHEKKQRAAEMSRSREQQRAVQRNKDSAADMCNDRDNLISEASEIVQQIQKLKAQIERRPHHSYRYKDAISKYQDKLRMKSNAAGQLDQYIAALNQIPPRLVSCGLCSEEFDANRKEPEACRRHRGMTLGFSPILQLLTTIKGQLEFNFESNGWPYHWDAADDTEGVIANITKDVIAKPQEHNHSLPYFKWSCCQRSGNSPGCNIGKHLDC